MTRMFHICSNACMPPSRATILSTIESRARERGFDYATLSRLIGRNDAYVQQFIKRGTPRRLPEDERLRLAMALDIDERELGARDPWSPAISR